MELSKEEISHLIISIEKYIKELREHKDQIDQKLIAPHEIRKELSDSAQNKILINENILLKLYENHIK